MRKVVLLAGMLGFSAFAAFAQTSPVVFNARGLVVISDADMAASAFADGKLLRDNAAKDKLTSVKFPMVRGASSGSVLVSNSVLTHSNSMAIPAAGGLAFVLESRLRPEDDVKEYKDVQAEFPEGQKLFVIDIVNLSNPKVKFGFNVGKNPTSVDINKNELLVTTEEPGKELVFLEIDQDGKPTRFVQLPSGLDSTEVVTNVAFHPSGDFAAVTLGKSKSLALYKIIREGGKLKNIEQVGTPLKAGDEPTFGKFSKDGKYYFVLDSKGAPGKADAESELLVVEFSQTGGEHKLVGQTPVGLNASAFTVSPDGLVAVVGAGKSIEAFTNGDAASTITLLNVGADGVATKVADYPFDGIYANSIAFDKDGSNLAVSVFEYLEYGDRKGGVEFWTVEKGGTPALKKQPGKISVERGSHTLRVIE